MNKKIKLENIFTKEYIAFTQKHALNQTTESRKFFVKVIRELKKLNRLK